MNEKLNFEINPLSTQKEQESIKDRVEIRVGAICPKCLKGKFDYDGLLNLVCQNCGFTSGGCFT